jgi:putative DNA primase/helicase
MNQTQTQYLMNLPYTNPGNAERLHAMIGSDWKFIPQINRWVHWNGKYWQEETNSVLRNVAVAAYRQLASAIRSLPQTLDTSEQKHRSFVLDWLQKAETLHRFNDTVDYWQGCNATDFEVFDANPYLLNVQNGTLNLATGTLQPFDKKDLLTKISAASYEEKETVSSQNLWLQTVNTILPDPSVRRWIQKFMGYCLTGSTEEEKFVIAYGPGGSGKGTFFETIAAAISDYKAALSIDTLLATAYVTDGQRPTPEFAKLPGKRYVLSSESNSNRRLDEAKVKLLTGGDTLTARHLNAEPFEFRPTFKLILQTNHLPAIADAMDKGIRRRLVIVPFTAQIENRDTKLKQKLLQPENLNACLAWCVEGARLWFAEGLDKDLPDEMAKAASTYYEESDLLQQWLDERTEPSLGFLKFSKALDDFNNWLYRNGNHGWQRKTFTEAMELHGKMKIRRTPGFGYDGLCLR